MAKTKSKNKNPQETPSGDRTITVNRRAFFNYEILERYEAGLVLTGSEIKSIRTGRVDLSDAYVRPVDGEMWLNNAHIATYGPAGIYNHEPKRSRKVLLHRAQIIEMSDAVHQKGLTIVALRLYIRNHVAKVQLGLARGKRQYDKRRTIRDRELDMQARQALSAR